MARPKKTETPQETPPVLDTTVADTALESAKGRFTTVVVVGILPDGNIDIATSNPNYAILQWMLGWAKHELYDHQKAGKK